MKIGVLTSGGDSPGMNVAIRAVVRSGIKAGHKVYAIFDGYRGLLDEKFKLMKHEDVSGIITEGGTILGTSRVPEFLEHEVRLQAVANLQKKGIEGLVVIGGDGTYHGAMELTKLGIKCVGIPGTIDNDIAGTDYTLGFNTAVETIVDALDKLRDTSTSHQRCSVLEVMGRKCGDLALYAGICGGAEFIITPENPVDKEKMIKRLTKYKNEGRRHAIVVLTEKICDPHALAKEITDRSGFSSRATVLGYIQRGGSPCPQDRILGSRMGDYAVELLTQGIFGVAVGVSNERMIHMPFNNIVGQHRPKNELYKLVKQVS